MIVLGRRDRSSDGRGPTLPAKDGGQDTKHHDGPYHQERRASPLLWYRGAPQPAEAIRGVIYRALGFARSARLHLTPVPTTDANWSNQLARSRCLTICHVPPVNRRTMRCSTEGSTL